MKRPILKADEKQRATILKNRISAQRSVERRRQLIQDLQRQNDLLIAQNRSLEERVGMLEGLLGSMHLVSTKPLG